MAAGNADEEQALVARVAQGDEEAFERLFRRYERPVYTYLLRRLDDPVLTEDVAAEVMVEVWKAAKRFRGEAKVSTWIFGIAHHQASRALRCRRPVVPLEEVADEPVPGPDPEEAAAAAETRTRIRQAIRRLSPEHRAVIELTFFQGLAYQDIARILRCPVNTVKTRMFYARQRLRAVLEGMGVTHAS